MSYEFVEQLHHQNRLLKALLTVACVATAALTLAGAKSAIQKACFSEIEVERINIVNPDGSRAMAIAGRSTTRRATRWAA